MNESFPAVTPVLEKKTPELSEEGKKEFANEITIANTNIESLVNTPDAAAKLDKDPALKEKVLKKIKFLATLALGLGVAIAGAATIKDMGAATAGIELLTHLPIIGAGIVTAMAGYAKFGPETTPSQYSR